MIDSKTYQPKVLTMYGHSSHLKIALSLSAVFFSTITLANGIAKPIKSEIAGKTESALNNAANDFANNFGNGNTEISIKGIEGGSPDWNIVTTQPIGQITDEGVNFWQGSVGSYDQAGDRRTTLNLGVGKRWLVDNKSGIVGLNTFLDHEFKSGHMRASIGAEYIRSEFDLHANYYNALSNAKTVNGVSEEALDGYDLIAKGQAPYLPWLKLVGKKHYWDRPSNDDVKGESVSLEMLITPSVTFEVGQQDDNYSNESDFGRLTFSYPPKGNGKSLSETPVDSVAWRSSEDVSKRLLDKVERTNKIIIAKGGVTVSRAD